MPLIDKPAYNQLHKTNRWLRLKLYPIQQLIIFHHFQKNNLLYQNWNKNTQILSTKTSQSKNNSNSSIT